MTDTTLQVHAESAGKQDGLGMFVTRVSFPFENRPKQATPRGLGIPVNQTPEALASAGE